MESLSPASMRNPMRNFRSTLFCPFRRGGMPLSFRRKKQVPTPRFDIYNIKHERTQGIATAFLVYPSGPNASATKISSSRETYCACYSHLGHAIDDEHGHDYQQYRQGDTKDNCCRWDHGRPNEPLPRRAFKPVGSHPYSLTAGHYRLRIHFVVGHNRESGVKIRHMHNNAIYPPALV
jgi:hypothetical protein